jgi:hypothetical protein
VQQLSHNDNKTTEGKTMDPKMIFNAAIAASALAMISLIVNSIIIATARRQRRSWVDARNRFDEEIESLSRDLDTASRQAGEHARRIAWLESRARFVQVEPKTVEKPVQQKITITERRHRVMSLARRGQDINTIARTLGMNHGEVELMINLGKAA